jgi:hypothetical protein
MGLSSHLAQARHPPLNFFCTASSDKAIIGHIRKGLNQAGLRFRVTRHSIEAAICLPLNSKGFRDTRILRVGYIDHIAGEIKRILDCIRM